MKKKRTYPFLLDVCDFLYMINWPRMTLHDDARDDADDYEVGTCSDEGTAGKDADKGCCCRRELMKAMTLMKPTIKAIGAFHFHFFSIKT